MNTVKEKITQWPLKMVRKPLLKGDHCDRCGDAAAVGSCCWGERLSSTPNTTRKVGIHSHEADSRSVERKLLRGSARERGILAKVTSEDSC